MLLFLLPRVHSLWYGSRFLFFLKKLLLRCSATGLKWSILLLSKFLLAFVENLIVIALRPPNIRLNARELPYPIHLPVPYGSLTMCVRFGHNF